VSDHGVALASVNRKLLGAVLAEEAVWRQITLSAYRNNPAMRQAIQMGIFRTSIDLRLVSASTRVVSVLMPEVAMIPNGTGGETWLSITVQVPSGEMIRLRDLFARGDGLRVLAQTVFRQIEAASRCFASEGRLYHGLEDGFSPAWSHYRYFSLTASGLAIGFPTASIAPPPCGRIKTIVPYQIIAPYLTNLGKNLVAGVRAPKRSP
jgi:hypothetical protein